MAKQTFTTGQVLSASQVNALQANDYNTTVSTKTASYVLVAADVGTTIVQNVATANTVTVNTGLFAAGDTLRIQNIGAGIATVTAGTATVNTANSLALPQWGSGILYFTSASAAIFFPSAGAAGASFVGCRLTKSVEQSISNAITTTLTFDTETFDTDGFHDNITNNSRITIPSGKAGKYLITCNTMINAPGSTIVATNLFKNGSSITINYISASMAVPPVSVISQIFSLAVADYIELKAYQESGVSKNVLAENFSPGTTVFSVTYLGA